MDPSWIQRSVLVCFFRIFATIMKKQEKLTHKDACKKVLEELGGRASLSNLWIVLVVQAQQLLEQSLDYAMIRCWKE